MKFKISIILISGFFLSCSLNSDNNLKISNKLINTDIEKISEKLNLPNYTKKITGKGIIEWKTKSHSSGDYDLGPTEECLLRVTINKHNIIINAKLTGFKICGNIKEIINRI